MKYVMVIDASKNAINVIKHNCFKNITSLKVVKLNNNIIQRIQKFAFHELISLLFIDLSNNMLTLIPEYFVISSNNLSFLSLHNNPLDAKTSKVTLLRLNVKYFTTTQITLCCLTSENVKCSNKVPWYMSCSNLLLNLPIKFTFCFITLIILLLNTLSIYLTKYIKGKDNTKSDTTGVFNIIVTSINMVDITGSIPLIILWGSDLYYKNNFVFREGEWKSVVLCFISCGINIHFVLTAAFLQILLSCVRYLVVTSPFDTTFKRNEFIFKVILIGYSSSWLFASLITILFWLINGSLPTVYCSPFFDPSKTFSLVEYLTFVIIGIHFFAFSFNFVIHIKLVMTVMNSEGKHVRTNSKQQDSRSLNVQILCITCSHMLCWISDMVFYVTIYFMEKYPMEIMLWKFVCISPLNSILIPIILVTKKLRS